MCDIYGIVSLVQVVIELLRFLRLSATTGIA